MIARDEKAKNSQAYVQRSRLYALARRVDNVARKNFSTEHELKEIAIALRGLGDEQLSSH